ncbi:hypothetical protein MO867_00460 [Microbulbifer sp. OS29]|uniref:Uncharacterized protein n=1 Tax=Microbulbifer okhotskensis TaxID=2926617 RepID=A0A9X2ENQ8_9GAMM|nr:hypothetical protein [Microbulbifer okhotskensis]MCO1332796.1 hypothetical protein [Microbulbifer okhotskensis]
MSFMSFMSFAMLAAPLAVMELYFYAQQNNTTGTRLTTIFCLWGSTMITAVGSFAAATVMGLSRLGAI